MQGKTQSHVEPTSSAPSGQSTIGQSTISPFHCNCDTCVPADMTDMADKRRSFHVDVVLDVQVTGTKHPVDFQKTGFLRRWYSYFFKTQFLGKSTSPSGAVVEKIGLIVWRSPSSYSCRVDFNKLVSGSEVKQLFGKVKAWTWEVFGQPVVAAKRSVAVRGITGRGRATPKATPKSLKPKSLKPKSLKPKSLKPKSLKPKSLKPKSKSRN